MNIKRVLDSVDSKNLRRLLRGFYHRRGQGRKPYNPLSMLKAQLLKHLLRIPNDRRLALRLKHDWRATRACRFRRRTPSHGLFTQFRHRLARAPYTKISKNIALFRGFKWCRGSDLNTRHSGLQLRPPTRKSDALPG